METLFIFIIKSSGLLILFYVAYYFLLRKETFFNSNRWFLLTGLITSVLLPFFVYRKNVWVDSAPSQNFNLQHVALSHSVEKQSFDFNWSYIILAVYAIGFIVLLIKFALDFYNLNSVLKGKKIQQQADFKFIDINENIAPFSYFDYIVYNSSMYTALELENIIEHEKVHSDQNHTVDVLISRIFCMLFWFNPVMWFYKKAISQNLEFIADNEAAKRLTDKKAYQYTLLKITTHDNCVAITNHFYQSLIKKRIVMLNKNQSKKRNSWKYCTVIPALIAFVLLFQVEIIAREKQTGKSTKTEKTEAVDRYVIKKTSSDQELKELAEKLKSTHNIDLLISDVKRNSKNELTAINITIKNGTDQVQAMQIGGDKAIKDYTIIITTNKNGTKKIDFNASNDKSDTDVAEVKQIKINKTQKINHETNVKVNDNTNQVSNADTTVNTNVNTVVNTNINTDDNKKETTIVTIKDGKKVVVKNSFNKLLIVDGVVISNSVSTNDLESNDQGIKGSVIITTTK